MTMCLGIPTGPIKAYIKGSDGQFRLLGEATSDTIEALPQQPTLPMWRPISNTFSFCLKSDTALLRRLCRLFRLPPRRFRRLSYKTTRQHCAKRNK